MGKAKTSKKRRGYLEKLSRLDLNKVKGVIRHHPLKELLDPKKTALAILECLQNNDPEGVMEMVESYVYALNKTDLQEEAELPKSTLYSAFKHRNPTIKTLAKIVSCATSSHLRLKSRAAYA